MKDEQKLTDDHFGRWKLLSFIQWCLLLMISLYQIQIVVYWRCVLSLQKKPANIAHTGGFQILSGKIWRCWVHWCLSAGKLTWIYSVPHKISAINRILFVNSTGINVEKILNLQLREGADKPLTILIMREQVCSLIWFCSCFYLLVFVLVFLNYWSVEWAGS